MKMFLVIYSREVDEDVVNAFKEAGIPGYTKMEEVCGEGRETEPKLGTHIWPGMNNLLFVVLENEKVPEAKEVIMKLKRENPRAGIKSFLLPLEDCL